jgi:hypothetical protein
MSWLGRFGLLLLPVAAISILQVVYIIFGATPSGPATLLFQLTFALAFILWMETDARHRRILPCHDFGFLVGIFFPLSLVWYVFWSRGRKGVLALAGLLTLLMIPWLSAMAAWLVMYGRLVR